MRILIAEDDPKVLKSLIHIFETNNYAVDGVDNGDDAMLNLKSGDVITFNLVRGGEKITVDITMTDECLSAY